MAYNHFEQIIIDNDNNGIEINLPNVQTQVLKGTDATYITINRKGYPTLVLWRIGDQYFSDCEKLSKDRIKEAVSELEAKLEEVALQAKDDSDNLPPDGIYFCPYS